MTGFEKFLVGLVLGIMGFSYYINGYVKPNARETGFNQAVGKMLYEVEEQYPPFGGINFEYDQGYKKCQDQTVKTLENLKYVP